GGEERGGGFGGGLARWLGDGHVQQSGVLAGDMKLLHQLDEIRSAPGLLEHSENGLFKLRVALQIGRGQTAQRFDGEGGLVGIGIGPGSPTAAGAGAEGPYPAADDKDGADDADTKTHFQRLTRRNDSGQAESAGAPRAGRIRALPRLPKGRASVLASPIVPG